MLVSVVAVGSHYESWTVVAIEGRPQRSTDTVQVGDITCAPGISTWQPAYIQYLVIECSGARDERWHVDVDERDQGLSGLLKQISVLGEMGESDPLTFDDDGGASASALLVYGVAFCVYMMGRYRHQSLKWS